MNATYIRANLLEADKLMSPPPRPSPNSIFQRIGNIIRTMFQWIATDYQRLKHLLFNRSFITDGRLIRNVLEHEKNPCGLAKEKVIDVAQKLLERNPSNKELNECIVRLKKPKNDVVVSLPTPPLAQAQKPPTTTPQEQLQNPNPIPPPMDPIPSLMNPTPPSSPDPEPDPEQVPQGQIVKPPITTPSKPVVNSIRSVTHGNGEILLDNGVYTGEIKNGKMCGQGKITYNALSEGSDYEGQFLDDMRHGEGTMAYKDGRVYTGAFKKDKKDGYGIMTYPNKDRYEGEFIKNKMGTIGKYFYHDRRIFEGNFQQGVPYLGIMKYPKPDCRIYEGQFQNGKMQGYGEMKYPDGEIYRGEFQNDKRHGEGNIFSEGGSMNRKVTYDNDVLR